MSEGVALCGHVAKHFVPCGLAEVSEVQFISSQALQPNVSLVRGAIGGRLSGDVPLPIGRPHAFLVPALDVLVPFGGYVAPIKLSPVNVRLGAGLLLEFGSP